MKYGAWSTRCKCVIASLGPGNKTHPAEVLDAAAARETYSFALRQHPLLVLESAGGTGGLTAALTRWVKGLLPLT